MKQKKTTQLEVLAFCRLGKYATVVTDDQRTKSFEESGAVDHASLERAISYLECKGYRIVMDRCRAVEL